jgi:formate hydrogenlyase subunit 3/multisubunit Na+/H+ antiporter MnhD subunit
VVLITSGLLLKAAVFPLHFWLPTAHANAPAPVSAALSALVVKAAVYLLWRLWFDVFGDAATPAASQILGVLGGAAVLWGSWHALTAERLKLLAAYSTVAQIGYLCLVFPLALNPGAGFAAWAGAVYLALSHAFAKAALFFAAGNVLARLGHDRIRGLHGTSQRLPVTTFALALAGIALVGLPPSGGFIGKWVLLNAALNSAQWGWVLVLVVGTLLAGGYIFRVLIYAFARQDAEETSTTSLTSNMEWTALALALVATVGLGFAAAPVIALLDLSAPFSGSVLLPISP